MQVTRTKFVDEGYGGTFLLTDTIPHICTNKLKTCVGVYFQIDAHRCFMAHINAWVAIGNDTRTRVCNVHEGLRIRWRVWKQFQLFAKEQSWNVTQNMARVRKTLVVACPEPKIPPHNRFMYAPQADMYHQVGGREFFARRSVVVPELTCRTSNKVRDSRHRKFIDNQRISPYTATAGFFVDRSTGVMEWLPYFQKGCYPLWCWRLSGYPVGLGAWWFTVDRRDR